MGDTFKEIEAGADLAERLLTRFGPLIANLFKFFTSKGHAPDAAMNLMADHITPGKPNADEVGK